MKDSPRFDNIAAWSAEFAAAIEFARVAHIEAPNSAADRVRFHDQATPYWVHPLWCAATLLQEPGLPLAVRKVGYVALLWHDVLEDTQATLPARTSEDVVRLVNGMSFSSLSDEVEQIWQRPKEVRLLKLYDKVSNLLDSSWMKQEKRDRYAEYTLRLADDVEKNFGVLNIVRIARAVAASTSLAAKRSECLAITAT